MKSKSDNFKLTPKEYLFLTVLVIIYFVGTYLLLGGETPKDLSSMLIVIGALTVAIVGVLFVLVRIKI